MFQNDGKEEQERIAVIKETKAEVFEKLLYYIYTGKVYFKSEDLVALMIAADTYIVSFLIDECEQNLSDHVTVENATTYLILAHLHDEKKLYTEQHSNKVFSPRGSSS